MPEQFENDDTICHGGRKHLVLAQVQTPNVTTSAMASQGASPTQRTWIRLFVAILIQQGILEGWCCTEFGKGSANKKACAVLVVCIGAGVLCRAQAPQLAIVSGHGRQLPTRPDVERVCPRNSSILITTTTQSFNLNPRQEAAQSEEKRRFFWKAWDCLAGAGRHGLSALAATKAPPPKRHHQPKGGAGFRGAVCHGARFFFIASCQAGQAIAQGPLPSRLFGSVMCCQDETAVCLFPGKPTKKHE